MRRGRRIVAEQYIRPYYSPLTCGVTKKGPTAYVLGRYRPDHNHRPTKSAVLYYSTYSTSRREHHPRLSLFLPIPRTTKKRSNRRWLCTNSGSASASGSSTPLSNVLYLRGEGKQEFYILGTAHVSKKSVEEVEELIERVKPDCVLVELCAGRAKRLIEDPKLGLDDLKQIFSNGGGMLELALRTLSHCVRLLGVMPGTDMRAAIEASSKRGIPVVYGDQDGQLTMKKLKEMWSWRQIWNASKVPIEKHTALYQVYQMLSENSMDVCIEKLKDRQLIRKILTELESLYPSLYDVMLTQRDKYLVNSLKRCKGQVVVGVVGMGHLDGIEKYWNATPSSSQNGE
jgi:hypothetical protein